VTTVIRLREGAPAAAVRLTGEQVRRLAATGLAEVRPGPAAGIWLVRADRRVGAARVGDIDLYVAPKVPIDRLLFLAGYARDPKGWRAQSVPVAGHDELVPAFAEALRRQVDRGTRQGLIQGYRTIDATSSVLRGRLRETQQLIRWLGSPLPLEVRYDEFTVDIPENRILATALDQLLRMPGVGPQARRMLRHLAGRFTGVTRLRPGEPLPHWRPSRLNTRLQPALRLAELVLAGRSVETAEGVVAVNGLMLDMARVFEEFLTVALRERIEGRYGGRVVAQEIGYLDHGRRIPIRPDLTWRRSGQPLAVIDAKYKREVPASDAYQMLAYCTAYGLARGHLVYVTGDDAPVRHVVGDARTEIVCHSLDLDQPPNDLLRSVDELADDISRSGTAVVGEFR
jgi:5-methylcytosine-specific restriction enzyme subunit McrC